ncbi:MAG: hypothetical protein IPG96_17730 [Proteobacteria bacterium]|nr:hypothetical protein [Pseudomonadota bacterium]
MRYAASDCFDTFPFPQPDPRTVIPALEDLGQRLYETRARYMVDTDQGLTQTYNQLKDPDCAEPRIALLRELHLELDRAVLAAYGWSDLEVPPYPTPATPEEEQALETFQDEVIDRLFVLNAQRAEEERLAGASTTKGKGKGKPRAASKGKQPAAANQLALLATGGSKDGAGPLQDDALARGSAQPSQVGREEEDSEP